MIHLKSLFMFTFERTTTWLSTFLWRGHRILNLFISVQTTNFIYGTICPRGRLSTTLLFPIECVWGQCCTCFIITALPVLLWFMSVPIPVTSLIYTCLYWRLETTDWNLWFYIKKSKSEVWLDQNQSWIVRSSKGNWNDW